MNNAPNSLNTKQTQFLAPPAREGAAVSGALCMPDTAAVSAGRMARAESESQPVPAACGEPRGMPNRERERSKALTANCDARYSEAAQMKVRWCWRQAAQNTVPVVSVPHVLHQGEVMGPPPVRGIDPAQGC